MSKPVLFYVSLSPPCRAVEYVAKELGVDLELKDFDVRGGQMTTPEYTAKNPVRTIPTLDDNGTSIYDSHAIALYLIEKYGKNDSLYPKDLVKRAKVNSILFFETQFLFGRGRAAFEPLFYHQKGFTYKYMIDNLGDSLERFERILNGNSYVAGDSITVADFACISSLSTIYVFDDIDANKYPNVTAWRKRMFEKYPHVEAKEAQAKTEIMTYKEKLWTDRSEH